jgi:hypothetical protein
VLRLKSSETAVWQCGQSPPLIFENCFAFNCLDQPELQVLKLETQAELARAQELYYDKRFVEVQVELFKVLGRNPTEKVAWHFLVQAAQCLKDGVSETLTGDTLMVTK